MTTYPKIVVSRALLDRTAALLATFAESSGSEGVVYWFGLENDQRAVVTTLIVPDAESSTGGVRTSPEANVDAILAIANTPLVLLGQAHSHPGRNVRHSVVDDSETFASFDGAISIVVPYFGRRGFDLNQCGVYRHIAGAFRMLSSKERAEHLTEIPGERDLRKPHKPLPRAFWAGLLRLFGKYRSRQAYAI